MTTLAAQTRPSRAPEYEPRATHVPPALLDLRRELVGMGLRRRAVLRDAKRNPRMKDFAA